MIDEVIDRASRIDWRRVAVFVVSAVPFAVAWLVGKLVVGALVAFGWVVAACQAGYQTGRGRS